MAEPATAMPTAGVSATLRLSAFWMAFRDGAKLALHRGSAPEFRWLFGLSAAVVVATAAVERSLGAGLAANRTLYILASFVLPFGAFASARLFTRNQRLDHSVWCLARYGASRRAAALGLIAGAGLLVAVAASLLVGAGLGVAYAGRPGLLADLWTSTWIAALGGLSYMTWFLVASAWGKGGRWRWLPLVLDFTIGTGTGWAAACFPRAPLAHLLGSSEWLGFSQQQSTAWLVVAVGALLLAAALRVRQ
jgi:hypothetical protein